jgi:predicted Rossmann-fold nucleotide-binding protein
MSFVDHAIDTEFIRPKYRDLLVVADEPDDLLERLEKHRMPEVRRWVTESET